MKFPILLAATALVASVPGYSAPVARHAKAHAKAPPRTPAKVKEEKAAADKAPQAYFHPSETRSTGTVTIGGQPITYDAIAGTLVVHSKGWEDTDQVEADADISADKSKSGPKPEASMLLHCLFQAGRTCSGPADHLPLQWRSGSSTIWLHMGAFGPVRRHHRTRHTPGAPYGTVNNDQSLLDASDLVFIDAPGTGFSRIAGKDKEKAFYGVDQDIHAFTQFITQFLTKYDRWNSPKYVFGESYGTMRAAGLVTRSRMPMSTLTA